MNTTELHTTEFLSLPGLETHTDTVSAATGPPAERMALSGILDDMLARQPARHSCQFLVKPRHQQPGRTTLAGLLALSGLLSYSSTTLAATCNSTGSGNWNTAATWTCGAVPTSADLVTVVTGNTVTVDVNAAANTLTIATSGTLQFATNATPYTLNVGAGGIQNSGRFDATNAGAIVSAATNALTHGIYNAPTGVFTAGAGAIAATATQGIGLENDGTFTSGAGLISIGILRNGVSNSAASFTVGAGGVTITETVNPNGLAPTNGTFTLNGNLTNGYNIDAGVATFSGTGKIILTDANHTIIGPVNLYNLEIAPLTAARTITINTGAITATGTTQLNGVLGNLISFTGTGNITAFTSYSCFSNGGITNITCNPKANQTITFGALSNKTYGDAPFLVSATASSSLAVSFAATGNCTMLGSTVTLTGAGSCTITASQGGDANYVAAVDVLQTFFTNDLIYNLTLATTGNGTGTVSSSGTPSGVSCGADCLTYITTTAVTLIATATNGSTFVNWSCTPAFTSGNTLTVNTTCTASFEAPAPIPHYHLSVQTDGTGTGTVTGSGSYPAGTMVTLEAVPDKGSTFVGWSAGCSNEMTLTADITCTATFMGLPPPRTLYITFAGTGQGQLSGGLASDSTGINCSSATPTCSYTVFGPQWVYPKLTPATGSELAGWSGDPACTQDGSSKILLLQDTHCTVTVNLKFYTLSVGRNVPGVTLTGDGLNCQDTPQGFRNLAGATDLTTCQASYPYGTTVKLEASPAPLEWEWVGWKGSCDSQGQVVITQDRLCQALYQEDPNVPNGIDGNGDGEMDAHQPHVMSLADKVEGSYITLAVNPECTVADSSTLLADSLDGHDPNHRAPQGLMYFEIRCSQTPVTMYFHGINRVPRNVELLKYGPTTPGDENTVGWYKLPNVQFGLATVGGKPVATVTYTLTDGQLGDSTGVDGKIVDPAGLSDSH